MDVPAINHVVLRDVGVIQHTYLALFCACSGERHCNNPYNEDKASDTEGENNDSSNDSGDGHIDLTE